MTTMVALKRALSLMPITRIAVITRAIRKAGRLKPISTPKIFGALTRSCARCTSSGERAERMALTLSRKACVPGARLGSATLAMSRATIFWAVAKPVQWS